MSFSYNVKEELSNQISDSRHCQIAEAAAFIQYLGELKRDDEKNLQLHISTENLLVLRKVFTLLNKTFNIKTAEKEKKCFEMRKSSVYTVILDQEDEILNLFKTIKLIDSKGVLHDLRDRISSIVLKQPCCQRAFLRGAFLCLGSMSDPAKSYHLEIVCVNRVQAVQLQELIQKFELDAKIVERKNHFVVYLKEGSNIVDFLNVCQAHLALMEFENLRIVKEMRNSINRRVNCETANIAKTVNAATRQVEDIIFIRDHIGFSKLPEHLREIAEVRLEYPEATLKELGQILSPAVGKSGVNHRLRKLSEIANEKR